MLSPCYQPTHITPLPTVRVFQPQPQADKLASLGGLGQEKSAKTREEATKLMNELVKNVADVLGGAHGALQSMRSRCGRVLLCEVCGEGEGAYACARARVSRASMQCLVHTVFFVVGSAPPSPT